MKRALSVSICFALTACPTHEHESAKPASPLPTTSASVAAASTPTAPSELAPDASSDAAALPGAFSELGQPCPETPGPALFCVKGKVVGVWRMVDTVHEPWPPADAELIVDRPASSDPRRSSLAVGAVDERLYVRLITCGGCRRVMGWAFVVELPALTDEQLHVVQERLDLPREPLLTTTADFRRAFADAGALHGKPHSAPPGVPGECINAPPNQPLPARCHDL